MKKNKTLLFICAVTLLFCIAIGFDLTPYLRGPAPYPPDWRWDYYFVNTLSRIWLPIGVIASILYALYILEKKGNKFIEKNEIKILIFFVSFSILITFSVLFFNRAGIPVLIHRIINPELNGYFTASLGVKNIAEFLEMYNQNVLKLPMHAQGHPPGGILFFSLNNWFSTFIPITVSLIPNHNDVLTVWNSLTGSQKLGALLASGFIPFLSSLSIIPLYFIAKLRYGVIAGVRSAFLFMSIPSIVLFVPINDVFLPLFTTLIVLFFLRGIEKQNKRYILLSGIFSAFALFFGLSMLPVVFIVVFNHFLELIFNKKHEVKIFMERIIIFSTGILIPYLVLFFCFKFNMLQVSLTLMTGLPKERHYFPWVFYNLYDFFIFIGIPLVVLFFLMGKSQLKLFFERKYKNIDTLYVSFFLTLLLLDISGTVRGEVARIWLPFVPLLIIPVIGFISKDRNFSNKQFLVLLMLQFMQLLVMNEFWVTLW